MRSQLTEVAGWSKDANNLYGMGNSHVLFENNFIQSSNGVFLSRNKGGKQARMQQIQSGMDVVPNTFIPEARKEGKEQKSSPTKH